MDLIDVIRINFIIEKRTFLCLYNLIQMLEKNELSVFIQCHTHSVRRFLRVNFQHWKTRNRVVNERVANSMAMLDSKVKNKQFFQVFF